MKRIVFSAIMMGFSFFALGQTQVITTGNNVINPANPYAADIVVGSDAGTRHDGSMMWWSNVSASRISNTNDIFYLSIWNTSNPNIGLAAGVGGPSFFNGNVGIGTTTPGTLLTLAKNNVVSASGNDGYLAFAAGTADASASGARISMSGVNRTAYEGVLELHSGITGTGNNNIQFFIGDTEAMRISSNGNIGIGTTDTHGYKFAVNGTIRSKEIKVEAGPWPDYVFKPNYNLPALSDIEKYINKNQHLPDLPSEVEVSKNGVSLGEMNKLLVKKLEEVTLYLIENDKTQKEQANKIRMLEKQIQSISTTKPKL